MIFFDKLRFNSRNEAWCQHLNLGENLGVMTDDNFLQDKLINKILKLEDSLPGSIVTSLDYYKDIGVIFADSENYFLTDQVEKEISIKGINYNYTPLEIEKRIENLALDLDLFALMKRHLHSLSGGEKKRVAMAKAIFLKPMLVIWVEPFLFLDKKYCQFVIDNFLINRKISVVFFTKDKQLAIEYADYMLEI